MAISDSGFKFVNFTIARGVEVYIFSSEFGDVPLPSIIMIQNLALNRQQPELTASASQPELTASAS